MTLRIGKLVMMLSLSASFLNGVAQGSSEADVIKAVTAHREEQQATFRNAEKSPLDKKERRKFKGLKYYPIDTKYHVPAKFTKNETPVLFKMKTTTTRLPDYVKYGEVTFLLDGQEYKLEVYQSPDLMKRPGYEDYLFIPFTDETNGKETYDVGRYLEFRIPTSEDVVIDFNLCYNPYCSYSPNYSCPIPPEVNHLPREIRAGEKKYKDISH